MAGDHFATPRQYAEYLGGYLSPNSYYTYKDVPLVSTFGGEDVTSGEWKELRNTVGHILIVPSFYQTPPSPTFFDEYSELNSWPQIAEGKVVLPTAEDKTFQSAVQRSGKLFMMGVSPLQFKHMDATHNWYRRGEENLQFRLGQVLELQPDMIELQTWNDAGESHYMGNIWSEAAGGDVIPAYTDGYNHTGYWEILPSFIQAWKRGDTNKKNMVPTNGAMAQGVF
ncbi:glycoside hydrolase [Ilyonectria sp. MPI-CAGE-AT-0026]|nr:glycoside hydrolase [Ilyonectria sp. MPI-CAGE-AT-0026]